MKLKFKKKRLLKPGYSLGNIKLKYVGGERSHFPIARMVIKPRSISLFSPVSYNKPVRRYWGDYDGDGIINGLDCEPRNKFKQGPQHKKPIKDKDDQIGWSNGIGEDMANKNISKIIKEDKEYEKYNNEMEIGIHEAETMGEWSPEDEEDSEDEEESTPGYPEWDKIPSMVKKINKYRRLKK